MPNGINGPVEECFYTKESPICHIPGFRYSLNPIAPIAKLLEWTEHKITEP